MSGCKICKKGHRTRDHNAFEGLRKCFNNQLPEDLRVRGKESQDGDNVAVDSPRSPADTKLNTECR